MFLVRSVASLELLLLLLPFVDAEEISSCLRLRVPLVAEAELSDFGFLLTGGVGDGERFMCFVLPILITFKQKNRR